MPYCERLDFGYRDRDGALTARRVEPHRLVQAGYRWYLVARDLDRDDWRTFRADRIETPRRTGIRFRPADPPDAAAFVARAVSTAPYRYQARVLLEAPADVLAGLLPPTVALVEPAAPGHSTLTVGSDSLDALAFRIAMLDLDFTVLEPPELAERLTTLAARLGSAARASAASDAGRAGQPP